MSGETWRRRAACRGQTDLFYPSFGDHESGRRARAICARCPVADPCPEAGLPERYGIWSGTSEPDRRRIRRARRTGRPEAAA